MPTRAGDGARPKVPSWRAEQTIEVTMRPRLGSEDMEGSLERGIQQVRLPLREAGRRLAKFSVMLVGQGQPENEAQNGVAQCFQSLAHGARC